MEKPTCVTCVYWEEMCRRRWRNGEEDVIGVCRIRSPIDDADFPERFDNDWCGEHQDFEKWATWTIFTQQEEQDGR